MFLVYFAIFNRLFPDVKRKGNASVPQLVIFTSEQVCMCDFFTDIRVGQYYDIIVYCDIKVS